MEIDFVKALKAPITEIKHPVKRSVSCNSFVHLPGLGISFSFFFFCERLKLNTKIWKINDVLLISF